MFHGYVGERFDNKFIIWLDCKLLLEWRFESCPSQLCWCKIFSGFSSEWVGKIFVCCRDCTSFWFWSGHQWGGCGQFLKFYLSLFAKEFRDFVLFDLKGKSGDIVAGISMVVSNVIVAVVVLIIVDDTLLFHWFSYVVWLFSTKF